MPLKINISIYYALYDKRRHTVFTLENILSFRNNLPLMYSNGFNLYALTTKFTFK